MGFIRGGLLVIVSLLFFICLLVMNSLMVITFSLDYDNIKTELVPVVKETLKEQINVSSIISNEQYPLMQQYCENLSATGDYVFNIEGYTFAVKCSTLSNGAEAVVNEAIDNFVYEQYYKQYDCEFVDCFKQQQTIPLFLISEHSKNYFQGKFYYSLLAVLILFGLMFLLIENKTNLPLVTGSLVILSSLLFAKLENVVRWLIEKIMTLPINIADSLKFFNLIFIQSYKVFLIILIIGIVLVVAGVILKFFAIGFKINEFFARFGKKDGKKIEDKKDKSVSKILKKK